TNTERMASGIHTGKILWDGVGVQAETRSTLDPLPVLSISTPASIAGDYGIGLADFGAAVSTTGVVGTLVAAVDPADAAGTSTTDACSPITNASPVAGHVAVVDRGTCPFVDKATHVQAAGAIGMVLVDNATGSVPVAMGG